MERARIDTVEAEAEIVDPARAERVRFADHQVLAALVNIVAVAGHGGKLLRGEGLEAVAVGEAVARGERTGFA